MDHAIEIRRPSTAGATRGCFRTGIPVLSVQPSASARCHDGALEYLGPRPIHTALARRLVPLVYGNVALDDARGGVDVTGDMEDKVTRMVELVQQHPQTRVHILTGAEPGLLTRTLLDATLCAGTQITALEP